MILLLHLFSCPDNIDVNMLCLLTFGHCVLTLIDPPCFTLTKISNVGFLPPLPVTCSKDRGGYCTKFTQV